MRMPRLNWVFAGCTCFVVYKTVTNIALSSNHFLYEPHHEKTCFMAYANNKDADQPAHLCNLISIFVVCCLYSIIHLPSPKFQDSSQSLYLSRPVWVLPGCKLPKTGFLMTWLISSAKFQRNSWWVFEPHHKKTCLWDFRLGKTESGLLS